MKRFFLRVAIVLALFDTGAATVYIAQQVPAESGLCMYVGWMVMALSVVMAFCYATSVVVGLLDDYLRHRAGWERAR